jgi:hypothetical protein
MLRRGVAIAAAILVVRAFLAAVAAALGSCSKFR